MNSRALMRAADADRERVAEELRLAHAEGRLDLAEYDERVRRAWAARTYRELQVLTDDLPPATATPAGTDLDVRRRSPWRGHAAVWLSVSVINLVIWAVVSLFTPVDPWWIWVAGPWGAVLLVGWITERVSGAKPSR
ncbi:MAG: DUF1707 domain-containing protein [Pseudonocardiaceae bacterium]